MISHIIEYSARNRLVIFFVVIFLMAWGYWALRKTPLDALPDLSDTQVIIYTEWTGRSPDLVEDQITYPISTTLLAAPKVEVVRGFSFLGSSFIYVIFEEGTDIYWARSRVLEYLQAVRNKIPADVNPVLGPDATSVGWGFSYAVVDETGQRNLSELRSLQDWNLKLALESVPGVSQVASVGGFVKQYQVTIDPNQLFSYNIPITKVIEAIRKSNRDVEGRVLEFSGIEYTVRGRGYIKSLKDMETIPVGTDGAGTPVFLKDVARLQLGPEIRRGLAELDGKGEVAGGIVVVRFGENVLNVIERVKEKIKKEIEPTLPSGVRIVTTYDRTDLIQKSIQTLKDAIFELILAVSIVSVVFLFHFPSALVVLLTFPVALLVSFICIYYLGVTSNIMSLGGIAIAIGEMVDASIVMVENAHKKLEDWEKSGAHGSRVEVIIEAAKEVGPSLFFSLLVITVGFLPVFALQSQAGRLFKPLAYTKTFAILFSSFLAITLTPALMTLFLRGKIRAEEKNPLNLLLLKIYEPLVRLSLRFKREVVLLAILLCGVTIIPFFRLGSEFMPPLYEGSLFYMPVTVPGASISEAAKLLQIQDRILKSFPEVAQVFGKAGRAETAMDPAPLEMFETVINLKPESEWRKGMTVEKLKDEMDEALTIPGVANSFTMPIKARIDMLSTGIRTPLGIKVMGSKLDRIEKLGIEIETLIKDIPGTRNVYAERVTTGYFLDIDIKREEAARYGLTIDDVQEVIQSAIGGANITTTVEGRERYPVNVRYARDLRANVEKLKRVLVPVTLESGPAQIPLGELADFRVVKGPTVIKSEEGLLTSYIYIDLSERDVGGYVAEANQKIASLKIPEGYRIEWSGEYEYLVKTRERLMFVIPLTALIIFFLIYLNTRSVAKTMIILLAVPFSLVGSFWLLYLLHYNLSAAAWVGMIALAGISAETGMVMFLFLELAYQKWKSEGRMRTKEDLREAILYGAAKRLRPKIMTVATNFGLIPILFSYGTGADVMKRIAAPVVGGLLTSLLLVLIIFPAIYMLWRERELPPE
ncbi:MAG: cation transporter [Deltaproteobacteria bacterium RBG_16_49_23]|nr:MAG: cation transporter [Deltaproteobacteria bacterium RBG_16_49_23]